ncbi:MAG TPA: hypothetical protein V6D02_14400 [Candidatus Obscuribacterales bacterium]
MLRKMLGVTHPAAAHEPAPLPGEGKLPVPRWRGVHRLCPRPTTDRAVDDTGDRLL